MVGTLFVRKLPSILTSVLQRPVPGRGKESYANARVGQLSMGAALTHFALSRPSLDDVQDLLGGVHETGICHGGFLGSYLQYGIFIFPFLSE